MMNRTKSMFVAIGVALTLSCTSIVQASDAARSGFLGDYSKLKENPRYPGSSDWIDQSAGLKKYDAMIIDPVTIRLSSGLVRRGARPDPKLLDEVLVYLRNALERELSKHVKIVRQSGDNVVRYRAAITGVATEGGIGSSAANILPAMFVLRTVSGRNDIKARLYMESEYSDSLTGTPVAAVMQSAVGGSVSGGSSGFGESSGNAQITLNHLRGVLDDWARKAGQILGKTVK